MGPKAFKCDFGRGLENYVKIRTKKRVKMGVPRAPQNRQKVKKSVKKGSQNRALFLEGSPRGPGGGLETIWGSFLVFFGSVLVFSHVFITISLETSVFSHVFIAI